MGVPAHVTVRHVCAWYQLSRSDRYGTVHSDVSGTIARSRGHVFESVACPTAAALVSSLRFVFLLWSGFLWLLAVVSVYEIQTRHATFVVGVPLAGRFAWGYSICSDCSDDLSRGLLDAHNATTLGYRSGRPRADSLLSESRWVGLSGTV